MLGKLLKYDFKAFFKILTPIYGAVILFSIICRALVEFNLAYSENTIFKIIFAIVSIFYFMSTAALFAVPVIIFVFRFYKNIIGDEGHLMFTLPVSIDALLLSKTISAIGIIMASAAVAFASMVITIRDMNLQTIAIVLERVFSKAENIEIFLMVILLMLVCIITGILICYTSMSIGQYLAQNKLLGSIVAYLGVNFATQMLALAIILTGGLILNAQIESIVITAQGSYTFAIILLMGMTIFYAMLGVAYYFLSRHFLTKKLNLS